MTRKLLPFIVFILFHLLFLSQGTAQVSQGFEGIATSLDCGTSSCFYTDPSLASVQHFLADDDGVPVSSTGTGNILGFVSEFTPSRIGTSATDGLTEGDAFGVAGITQILAELVAAPPEGDQAFLMEDTDGQVTLYFDYVDLMGTTSPMMSMQYFLDETTWESSDGQNDRFYARVEIDNCASTTTITLLDTDGGGTGGNVGGDIDDLGIEGLWNTLSADLSAYIGCRAQLIVEFDANAASEELGLDNIVFTEGVREEFIPDTGSADPDTTAFVTTWKTDNPGTSAANQITIPTFPGETYNYHIDWGDGMSDSNVTGNITHTYATPGIYTVSISGQFPRIYFNFDPEGEKLLTIEQWGDIAWTAMDNAFTFCSNLDVVAMDTPDLSNLFSLRLMFLGCSSLVGNSSIGSWDVSNVTDMDNLFTLASQFNQDIGSWNTSNVITMAGMFSDAAAFNQDIGSWNTESVEQIIGLFNNAITFNQDISSWDVSRVESFRSVFNNATAFNQDISSWNVSNGTDFVGMFGSASSFNQDLSAWDLSKAVETANMFASATSFNQDLSTWDVSSVENMGFMFVNATAFNQDLSAWDISSVMQTTGADGMTGMFLAAGLSTENYDSTLIGWSTLDPGETQIPQSITFEGGNSQFCQGETARQELIDTHGWIITDSGLNCEGFALSVINFILVDADTNNDIMSLSDGDVVQIGTLPSMNLNIRAETTSDVESVFFELSGTQNATRTENVAPYALFGDSGGNYVPNVFPLGNFELSATPYSADNLSGDQGTIKTINFIFSDNPLCTEFDAVVSLTTDPVSCGGDEGEATIEVTGFQEPLSFDWSQDPSLNEATATGLTAGEYTVTVTDANGCLDIVNFTLSDPFPPTATLAPFPDVFDTDPPFELTGGNPIDGEFSGPGVTDGFFDPSIGAGTYEITYTITRIDGCSNSATQFITVLSNTVNAVTGFVLVNADTNADIMSLMEGDIIDIASLPTLNLNVRAETTPDVESVFLELSGDQNASRTENVAPFALFGDAGGNYNSNVFPLGEFTLMATPYSLDNMGGEVGTPRSINFEFTDNPLCNDFVVEILSSIDPGDCGGNDGSIDLRVDGFEFPLQLFLNGEFLGDPGSFISFDGLVAGDYSFLIEDANGCSESFLITLEDPPLPEVTLNPFADVLETDEAFALSGGMPAGGTYTGLGVSDGMFDPSIGPGTYEITYSFTDGFSCMNSAIATIQVLSTSSNAVTGFVLVNADMDSDILSLVEGSVIDLSTLTTSNLNIRANTTPDVESVLLELTGTASLSRTENVAPYALFGDLAGDYNAGSLTPGNYSLTSTPYSGNGLSGMAGAPLTINFSVIDGGTNNLSLKLYPNPVVTELEVELVDINKEAETFAIRVHDMQGRLIKEYNSSEMSGGNLFKMPTRTMPSGVYYMTVYGNRGTIQKKTFIVNK